MLRFLFAFVVCGFFLPKSSVLVDAAVCPSANVILPCTCSQYTTNTTTLNCNSLNLIDSQASEILDAYLSSPGVSPVGQLYLSNNRLLTRVPVQVKSFNQLRLAYLYSNAITSIESSAFNASDAANPLQYLELTANFLKTIAPGAFKGIKSIRNDTQIFLYNNQLTRFESTVFQSLLEAMASFGPNANAAVQIDRNPFDCGDCHLAWLIRDNRQLLDAVYGATCSNGTYFHYLDPSGYANCPSFTCPLGYDGDYADPTTCSGYYICRANVAYKSDCPADLVFNSFTNQCDLVSNVEGPCGQFVCPSADGQFANPSTCSSYYLCIDNDPILLDCPPGFVFNPDKNQCDKPENVPNCN